MIVTTHSAAFRRVISIYPLYDHTEDMESVMLRNLFVMTRAKAARVHEHAIAQYLK